MKATRLPCLTWSQHQRANDWRKTKAIVKQWVTGGLVIAALLAAYGFVDLNEQRIEAELHAKAASKNAAIVGLMWRECVDKSNFNHAAKRGGKD